MNNTITNNNVAIKNLSDKTIETSDSISNLNEIIAKQNNTIVDLNKKLKNLEEKVKQKGIVNPTYSDLLHFVSEDHTESKTYIEENDRFVCSDFANTFISNFYRKGYYSCMALLYFEDGCHSIVAVNTTDEGIVYVEPQNDKIIKYLHVGDDYCSRVNWNCDWIIRNIKTCFGSENV